METIEYKKPIRENLFLIGMALAISLLFWFYLKINPTRLLSIDAVGATGFILIVLVVLTTGIRKITYDGNILVLRYGFWYTRKYQVDEIEKIECQNRASGVVILVYFKNGEKISRGLTPSESAKKFAETLANSFK